LRPKFRVSRRCEPATDSVGSRKTGAGDGAGLILAADSAGIVTRTPATTVSAPQRVKVHGRIGGLFKKPREKT
jgi:hypothetical protein